MSLAQSQFLGPLCLWQCFVEKCIFKTSSPLTTSPRTSTPVDKFPGGTTSPRTSSREGKHLKRTSSRGTTSPRTSSRSDNFPPDKFLTRHIPQPCARRAHRNPPTDIHSRNVGSLYPILIYLYWIFAANFMRNICHLNIHILVLNISCQQWGEECKFKVIYLYWIYSANNWGNICQLNVYYMLVLDISCQHLGDECKLGRFLYALRAHSAGLGTIYY